MKLRRPAVRQAFDFFCLFLVISNTEKKDRANIKKKPEASKIENLQPGRDAGCCQQKGG